MTALRTSHFLALSLLLAAAGCGTTATGTDGGSCANNPPGCICTSDSSCGGANPLCNAANGLCVPCLPSNDLCAQGQHCVNSNGTFKCDDIGKCITSADCPKKKPNSVPACCAGACIDDLDSDAANCGACNLKCTEPANGAAACVGGGCVIGKCNAGFENCDGDAKNGCETNMQQDVKHCGKCGNQCAAGGNSTPSCQMGACKVICNNGFSDCNGKAEDGCEVSTGTDKNNCGSCGLACGPLPNASSVVCINSACTAGACQGWYGDCDGKPANGCEADTQADPMNCGGCGKACPAAPNGTAGCAQGACTIAKCNAGFADCNLDPKDGCETKIISDGNNCGACGNICAGAHGAQSCNNGACGIAQCDQGFADCDGKALTGCEVNTLSDAKNCNGCGMACPAAPNTIPTCKLGVCGSGGCKPGFADCNADPADGCEVDITSTSNCGNCGVMCPVPANATAACRNGVCQIGACNGGFADCNQNAADGCEKNLNTDNANCGFCGIACVPPKGGNIGNQCTMGKCVVGGCVPGFSDCDGNPADCEAQTSSDANNCGGCGIKCGGNTPYCVNSVCSNSTHNIKKFVYDYSGGNGGCGDYSIWYSYNFGIMDYNACETLANNYGAQFMGQSTNIYSYSAPYANNNRWVGEATVANAFIGTASWNVVSSTAKNTANIYCVLAYANGTAPANGQYANTTAGLNGKTYRYQDYGSISEKTCYTNALAAGARPINPWMMSLANPGTTTFMSENHSCHGSTMYCCGQGSYTSDGGANHTYRCLLGYND